MSKMYFYYGTMDCGKTAMAIMKAYEFKSKGRNVVVLKPQIDTRSRGNLLDSRVGISIECIDILENQRISDVVSYKQFFDLLVVDEAQFLTDEQVRDIKRLKNVDLAILYGLKNNYLGKLFNGSKSILEVADSIREIPSRCSFCKNKATQNGRFNDNKLVTEGNEIDIGGNEKYKPLCFDCFELLKEKSRCENI